MNKFSKAVMELAGWILGKSIPGRGNTEQKSCLGSSKQASGWKRDSGEEGGGGNQVIRTSKVYW